MAGGVHRAHPAEWSETNNAGSNNEVTLFVVLDNDVPPGGSLVVHTGSLGAANEGCLVNGGVCGEEAETDDGEVPVDVHCAVPDGALAGEVVTVTLCYGDVAAAPA